jgi:hypothetical protein
MAPMTLIQAINAAMAGEMERNPAVVLLGEDIGRSGGVFRATEGLWERFGPERVMDTPLAESGILGMAIGMALNGLRPVVEIQFADPPASSPRLSSSGRRPGEGSREGTTIPRARRHISSTPPA